MAWNGTLKARLLEKFEGHSGPSFSKVSVRIIVVHIRWPSGCLVEFHEQIQEAHVCVRGAHAAHAQCFRICR